MLFKHSPVEESLWYSETYKVGNVKGFCRGAQALQFIWVCFVPVSTRVDFHLTRS